MQTFESYVINDNMSHPFKVMIETTPKSSFPMSGTRVQVYRYNHDKGQTSYNILDIVVRKVFIGKTTLPNRDTWFGDDHKRVPSYERSDGNTILLHVGCNRYIYIGGSIFEFRLQLEDDPATLRYYSYNGNNDVPYPVLAGSVNLYFPRGHCFVARSKFPKMITVRDEEDATYALYGHDKITKILPEDKKKLSLYQRIADNPHRVYKPLAYRYGEWIGTSPGESSVDEIVPVVEVDEDEMED